MKTTFLLTMGLAVCVWAAAGCDAGSSGGQSDDAEVTEEGSCDDVVWTYSNVGQPFVATWCTSCHHSDLIGDQRPAGTEEVNLEDYDKVLTFLERIELRALSENPSMPPAGGPTEEEIFRVQEWVACGAPQ